MFTINELQSMLAWHVKNCSKQDIINAISSSPDSYPNLSQNHKDKKHFAAQTESNRLAMLVKEINDYVRNQTTPARKNLAITQLGDTLTKLKVQTMQLQRIKDFKEAIANHHGVNWKTALLFNSTPATRLSSLVSKASTYKTDPLSKKPLSLEDGDRFQTKKTDYAYALVGNTRVNVGAQESQPRPENSPLESKKCLNSLYSQLIFDNNERICGLVFGLNERVEEKVDDPTTASKVTYFTIKHLTRLMSTYTDPTTLGRDLPALYKLAIEEAQAKAQLKNAVHSRFCAGHAFLNADGSYQIVGTYVGPNPPILYSYDPSNRVYTALQANLINGMNTINSRVPAGHMIVTMSSGVTSFLDQNLPSNDGISSPEQLVNILGKQALDEETRQIANAHRSQHEERTFGNDFSVFALELPSSEKRETLENKYSPSKVGVRTRSTPKQNFEQKIAVKKRKNKSRLKNLGMTSSLGIATLAAGIFIGVGVALCLTGVFSPLGLGIAAFGAGAAIVLPIAAKIAIDITLIATAGMILGGIFMLAGTIATYASVGIAQFRSARQKGNAYHVLPQNEINGDPSTAQNSPARLDSASSSLAPSPECFGGPTSAHYGSGPAQQSDDDLVEIVPVRIEESFRPEN